MAGRIGRNYATAGKPASKTLPTPAESTSQPPIAKEAAQQPREKAPSRPSVGPEGVSNAGLVVYDKGKMIYQAIPATKPISSYPSPATLSPEVVSSLLIHRVEPEYPEAARSASVQGEVSLRLQVDAEGVVQEVRVDSGDPLLAPAAVDAVRQWSFMPYHPHGSNQEFLAHVIVRFKLP